MSVPLSLVAVEKEWKWKPKDESWQWEVKRSKNEIFSNMVEKLTKSRQVDYVLSDSWYSSKDNMQYVFQKCATHFVMALKSNRLAARSEKEAKAGSFMPVEKLKPGKLGQ